LDNIIPKLLVTVDSYADGWLLQFEIDAWTEDWIAICGREGMTTLTHLLSGSHICFVYVSGATCKGADITPSSQPDRALSALTYGLKPSCNLSQSHYGRTPIACAHTTGNSNAHLIQVSYRNLLTTQYKQGCNQCEYFHTQVYQKLNTHQMHLNAPYQRLSTSVPTSPVERTN
jgi:hypothetical protein